MKILHAYKKLFFDLFFIDGFLFYIQLYYKKIGTLIGELLAILLFSIIGVFLVGDFRGWLFAFIYIFGEVSILDFYVKKQKKDVQ